jgi:hypothetical protein
MKSYPKYALLTIQEAEAQALASLIKTLQNRGIME